MSRPALNSAIALLFMAWPSCSDGSSGRPLGATCEAPEQCGSGLCGDSVCLDPARDDDTDGLLNGVEVGLGTSALSLDTDGDGVSDPDEVVDIGDPRDSDEDGFIDAVESALTDTDGDCIVDQEDNQDVIANLMSEARPTACGNGAYLGIGVCRLLDQAFRGTCAEPLGRGFACFDPVGECVLTVDEAGATYIWENGARHQSHGLTASDGTLCVSFTPFGVGDMSYTENRDGSVTCPDGTVVEVEASLHSAVRYCLQGADGCPGG